jgi:hypothetical protein
VSLLTPRPLPDRRLPIVAGALVVVLSLPVFLAAGWPFSGWVLGSGFWVAAQALSLVMARRGITTPTLRGSGPVAFGMMGRGIALMVVAIVVASFSRELALAGALVYAAAYTIELALSLTVYFQGEPHAPGRPAGPDRVERR